MKPNGRISRKKSRSSSRSKEIKESCSPNLPEELIFLILTWVPADILYSCMRFVCKKWHEIIRSSAFEEQHHPNRSSGLFFAQNNLGYFASLGKSKALRRELELPLGNKVRACCNGLLLLEQERDRTVHVANPFTRRITKVPPIGVNTFICTWSFVCVSSTKKYKVVFTYHSFDLEPYRCAVLTLGKGCAWKVIPHSQETHGYIEKSTSTFCVGDIVFWVDKDAQDLVGFCVESEETYRLHCPIVDCERCDKRYLPGGEFLSLVVQYDKRNLVDIWCLFDPKGVAEWKRMYKIESGGSISPFNVAYSHKIPVTWVSKEILVFHDNESSLLFGHSIKNGKTIILGRIKGGQPIFCCEFDCGYTWIQLKDDGAQS